MCLTSTTLLLVLFLLLFPSIGEGSAEREGSGENEATTFTSTTSATSLQTQWQTGKSCGANNLNATLGRSRPLHSPNYPKEYLPNSECWWTITAPVGYLVQINFITILLQPFNDILQLYDAPSQAEAIKPLATVSYMGVSTEHILSTFNYITMKFTSDDTFENKGFELTYKATAVSCPILSAPSNGRKTCYVDNNNKFFCKFVCQRDFKLSGVRQAWCLSNRTWTEHHVTCEKKTCSELAVPENGTKRCTDGSYVGSTCNLTCDDQYRLFGSRSRTCQIYSRWSGRITSCHACPALPTPRNGRKSCSVGYSTALSCWFFCDPTFKRSGSRKRLCQSDGTWTGIQAACEKETCPELPVPENGKKSCTNGNYAGSRCTFTCNDGAELFGSKSRVCGTYGRLWDGSDTSCQACPALPTPRNGRKSCSVGYNAELSCLFLCDPTFKRSGNKRRLCQSDGTWTGIQAACEKEMCPELPVPENGKKRCTNGNYVGSKCNITCNDGFGLFGSKSRVCNALIRRWIGRETYCQACPEPPTPSNGRKTCYILTNNSFCCRFSCNSGYTLSGSDKRLCRSNGNWTGSQATCERTTCPALAAPSNGTMRCTNGSDPESECSFTCNDGFKLFGSKFRKCDGGQWDSEDTSCQDSASKPTCDVRPREICDGKYDCPDKTDETGCTCPRSKFGCDCYETGCTSLWGCIDQTWHCDGRSDCSDSSDEWSCEYSETRFQCIDGDYIDRSKVNDGNIDCIKGDDEFICNMTRGHVKCDCMHDDDRCTSSGRCIPNSWIGDTISDCEDHNDEPCNASRVWCDKCWVIVNHCLSNLSKSILLQKPLDNATRCRSLTIPSDQNQLLETNWICITSPCGKCLDVFQCGNGQFIDNGGYCDTIPQCNDGSDELMKGFGFRCSGKSRKGVCILPQKNLYDSVAQCADSSDLCFVNGEFRCFSCLDGRLIVSAKQVCDGIVDCYDMSDECLCTNQSVCNAVLGEEKSRCPSNQMPCYNDTDCIDMDKVLCNSSVHCVSRSNQRYCQEDQQTSGVVRCYDRIGYLIPVSARRCDGRPECKLMTDECRCEPRPSFCDGECAMEAVRNWKGNLVCDGYVNLVSKILAVRSHFNDSFCAQEVENNCTTRFYCKSKGKISIDKRYLCDGTRDCDDHSDENITHCGNIRFECTKGNAISVDRAFVCNGIVDCDKGEDEAPQLCAKRAPLFSDQFEMISSPVLRALFWIMGLFALGGNIITNIYTAKDALLCKNSNAIKLANDIFILNLTISDFLMGVYLIAVVTQGQIYSGSYGLVDREWRSSSLCSGLGTLAVLSSETSAFIMTAMSTFRLATVYKPFLSTSIKVKWIVIAGCSCWILSFLLAAVPWFPFDSGYFISDAWFPNLILKTSTVSKSEMLTLAKRVSVGNPIPMTWFKVKQIISDAFKYNPIKGEFGYYGETSVCMPRFYAAPNEAAWQYSIFLITLNFLLFIYMVFAYVLVYKKASGMKQCRSTKKDPNKGMQKRITRLLLTDFCCWIPVCIMGYLSVAGVPLSVNAYVASAGFLLPINSAMNPILYSKFIGQEVSYAKKRIIEKFLSICSCLAGEADIVERNGARAEDIELRGINANN